MSTALRTVKKFFPQVKKIVDAKTNAHIEVTEKDANPKGIKKHNECAMAVACKRKFKLDGVIIARSVAYLIKGNKARRFILPPSVSREIVSFDRGAGFAPGNYELSKVNPSAQIGMRKKERGKGGSNTNTGEGIKTFRHLTTGIRHVIGGVKSE